MHTRFLNLDPNNGTASGGASFSSPSADAGGTSQTNGSQGASHAPGRGVSAPSTIAPPNTPPPGMRFVADSEYSRIEARAKMLEEWGIDEKAAPSFGQLVKAIKQRGDDPALLANLLAGQQQKRQGEDDRGAGLDPAELESRILDKMRREQAMAEYDRKTGELPKSVKAKLIEFLGKEDDPLADVFYKAALHDINETRYSKPRDKSDPLFGVRGADLDDESLGKVFSTYEQLAKTYKSSRVQSVAEAVSKARSGTPAGNTGGNSDGQRDESNRRPKINREALAAKADAILAGARR